MPFSRCFRRLRFTPFLVLSLLQPSGNIPMQDHSFKACTPAQQPRSSLTACLLALSLLIDSSRVSSTQMTFMASGMRSQSTGSGADSLARLIFYTGNAGYGYGSSLKHPADRRLDRLRRIGESLIQEKPCSTLVVIAIVFRNIGQALRHHHCPAKTPFSPAGFATRGVQYASRTSRLLEFHLSA